jgi:uncharacterized membrane protein YhaH (DUF805 family)
VDWQRLFLSPQGRIGQREFWIGFAILFVSGFVLGLIPFIGQLIGILLIYPQVCVFVKRLHDFGKTGWLYLAPLGLTIVLVGVGFAVGGAAMFAAGAAGDGAGGAAALGGMGIAALFFLLAFVVNIAFLLWVGLSKGDPGSNQYGPPSNGVAADTFA